MTACRAMILGCAMLSASVLAQDSGFYGSAAVTQLNVDAQQPAALSFSPHALNLIAGYRYSNSISAEARYGFGVRSSSDQGVKFETDYTASVLAKPRLYLTPDVALYVVGGFSRGKFNIGGADTTLNSVSYGGGIQYDHNPRTSYFIDWIKLIDKSDYNIKALSLGVTYRF